MNGLYEKKEKDMLDKIYCARQCEFEESADEDRKLLAQKLNNVTIEEIESMIQEDIIEQNRKQEVLEKLDKLVEDYEIKMGYYLEKGYKEGFKDAMNLLEQCKQK